MHDKLPPHSIEAEQGVLGSIFLLPAECLPEAIEKIKSTEVFYDLRHRTIYETMLGMYDSREALDTITVNQRLKDMGKLEAVGGGAYVSSLPDGVPSAANIGYYLNVLLEKFVLRRILQVSTRIIQDVYTHEGEVDSLVDSMERDVLGVAEIWGSDTEQRPVKALVMEALSMVEELHQKQGAIIGIPTGFHDFDRMTNGLMNGELIIIAARPSVGKTSLAMNIADHTAGSGIPTGVFSLEMTSSSLVTRMLCSAARINIRDIQAGVVREQDFKSLALSASRLAKAPLFVDDTSGLSILQLRAKARRMHQRHGLKLLIVDYLQMLHSTNPRAKNREQEIADISGGLKALAKELHIPVVVLSQLNRDIDKGGKRLPQLADLRESGAIEQDADLVGMLYRQEEIDPEKRPDVMKVGLLIAKQRNGPTGVVNMVFLPALTRFESAARIDQ